MCVCWGGMGWGGLGADLVLIFLQLEGVHQDGIGA